MAKRADSIQFWVRPIDRRRLERLASLENRNPRDQFAQIIDEAAERRGIDPDTLKPSKPNGRKRRRA